ncbi:MAG: hypothetical protein ACYDBJ_23470 [Aggregatilineales bacterium]
MNPIAGVISALQSVPMFSNPANLSDALSQAQRIAPLVMGAAMCFALLLIVAAAWQFRLSRVDRYWRFRRAAGQRGARLATIGALCLLLAGGTCAADAVAGMFVTAWHSTPTSTPSVVIVVVPNATPTRAAHSITCTATPTVTRTGEPTSTVTPTVTGIGSIASPPPACQTQV